LWGVYRPSELIQESPGEGAWSCQRCNAIECQTPLATGPDGALCFTEHHSMPGWGKAAPVRSVALLFDSVRVTTEVPPDTMVAGLNALVIVGETRTGAVTVRMAMLLAAPATGVCVVVTPEVWLGLGPTLILHLGHPFTDKQHAACSESCAIKLMSLRMQKRGAVVAESEVEQESAAPGAPHVDQGGCRPSINSSVL
jgi:hypothetical protein